MEVSGQLHTLATLYPEENPQYPLKRRLGGPQSQPGHGGKENHCGGNRKEGHYPNPISPSFS